MIVLGAGAYPRCAHVRPVLTGPCTERGRVTVQQLGNLAQQVMASGLEESQMGPKLIFLSWPKCPAPLALNQGHDTLSSSGRGDDLAWCE